ncbi:Ja54 [Japanese cytomegalovirus]|nr:Ja54 [Japanese cytomegalovirus]
MSVPTDVDPATQSSVVEESPQPSSPSTVVISSSSSSSSSPSPTKIIQPPPQQQLLPQAPQPGNIVVVPAPGPDPDYRLPDLRVVRLWLETLKTADRDNFGRCVRHAKTHRTAYHLTAYEPYLIALTDQYNGTPSVTEKASYLHGCLFLSFPVIYNNTQGGMYKHDWSNVAVPRTMLRELFFLLCSTSESPAIFQPIITKGGTCASMVVYPDETASNFTNPQHIGFIYSKLVMIPFVPHAFPSYGVPFLTLPTHMRYCWIEEAPFGHATLTRYNDHMLFHVEHLTWTSKRITNHGQKKMSRYTAQFKGMLPDTYLNGTHVWTSSKNVQYEFMGLLFTINIDTLCLDLHHGQCIGSISSSYCHRVADKLTARNMPRSFVFYLLIENQQQCTVQFNRNPYLFFSGDGFNSPLLNEPNPFYLTVHAPYDINFGQNARQTVEIDIRYAHTGGRCFLVANLPYEDSFYTGMCVWQADALKVTLWSRLRTTIIPQGTPIAVLYQINETDGNLYAYNHNTVFRQVNHAESTAFYLSDLKLPTNNFLTSP